MVSKYRIEYKRDRTSRYPRTSNVDGETIYAKTSEMDYLKRVKKKINLSGIKNKTDLEIRLSREGLLGNVRQYKQLNILAEELEFERIETGEQIHISKDVSKQTIRVYGKPRNIYRDSKGRFKKHVR